MDTIDLNFRFNIAVLSYCPKIVGLPRIILGYLIDLFSVTSENYNCRICKGLKCTLVDEAT